MVFELTMTETDWDVTGLSKDISKSLLVSGLTEHYVYGPTPHFSIKAFVMRPVTVFQRTKATLVEAILKIGSLLGILSLFSILIQTLHFRSF